MEDFQVLDSLPLLAPKYPIIAILIYWIFIGLMKQHNRKNKSPLVVEEKLFYFAMIHNIILVVLSFLMMFGVAFAAFERAQKAGWFSLICGHVHGRELISGKLGFWVYVYYLSKYYELLDTVLLTLKNKPIIPLHIYHHTTMIIAAWNSVYFGWLEGSWWCVFVNSIIHFFMYTYYTLSLFKVDVWWKKHLTSAQIFQVSSNLLKYIDNPFKFMTGLVFVQVYFYYYFQGLKISWQNGLPHLDFTPGCGGHLGTAFYAHALNFSFFCLFIRFYIQTYKRKEKVK